MAFDEELDPELKQLLDEIEEGKHDEDYVEDRDDDNAAEDKDTDGENQEEDKTEDNKENTPEDKEDTETDDKEDESDNQEGEVQKIKVNYLNSEIELSPEQINTAFGNLANKPKSDIEGFIEQAGISADDLQLLADIKNGNKGAVNEALNRYGIEEEPIYEEEQYQPTFTYEKETELDRASSRIFADQKLLDQYREVSKVIPEPILDKILSDAGAINDMTDYLISGKFQKAVAYADLVSSNATQFGEILAKKLDEQEQKQVDTGRHEKFNKEQKKSKKQKTEFTEADIETMSQEDFEKIYGF